MAKRRRRNAPITKAQARTLRAILALHGYKVSKKRKNPKAKRAKHRRVKVRRVKARRTVRAKVKAPKRLRSGSVFKRKGRKFRVVSFTRRVRGRKVRIRFVRRA